MTAAAMTAVFCCELRSAAWCRREAATHPKGSPARKREIHEGRNRIREARWARVAAGLLRGSL